MARDWIKLWTYEWLLGSTRYELTPAERSIWTDFLALAGLYHKDGKREGKIPADLRALARTLNVDQALLQRAITKFEAHGKIQVEEDGIRLINWQKYNPSRQEIWTHQYPEKARESQRRYDRKRHPKTSEDIRRPPMTADDPDRDKDEDKGNGDIADAFAIYEQEIGVTTPHIVEQIRDALQCYPEAWVADAIKIAVERNKRSWRYIEGILKSWVTQGRGEKAPLGVVKTIEDYLGEESE